MADARVDRREAVDVEHEQRELLASASGSADLAVEQGVEGRAVVEVRQRIAIGHGIRLAQLERRLERRTRHAQDVLERGDVDLAELAIRRPREHGEHAGLVRRVEERDREPVADRVAVARGVVSVERDLDRACAAVVRHSEPSDLRYLALGEADCRQDRLLLRPDDGNRGIGGRLLARELEHADDVRVIGPFDRRCVDGGSRDRRGDSRRERLVERVAQRLRELREAVVVALEHRRDDLLVAAEHAAEREDEEREARGSEKEREDGEGDRGV